MKSKNENRNHKPKETNPKVCRPVVYASIYARYSSDMQSPTSARDQIERANYLASRNEIPSRLYANAEIKIDPQWVFKDEAVTGRIAGRFGYQAVLEGIRQKQFHILLVDDLSRLTRSLGNLLGLYDLLKHYDVELVSITDRISSADPNARTYFTFKGMVADFGNEAHAGRTIRGLQARAREGFSTGKTPYAYASEATQRTVRKGREVLSHFKILKVDKHAKVVVRIFELYAEGYGKAAIAKILNKDSIPPSSPNSKHWQPGPIGRILNNEKYIGRWISGRYFDSRDPETGRRMRKERPRSQWIVKNREDLRIIPQELWDKVNKRNEQNKNDRHTQPKGSHKQIFGSYDRIDSRHLLSGVMACPKCEGTITLVSGRRDGYYGCVAAHRKGTCDWRKLIRRKRVEKAVLDYLDREIVNDKKLTEFAAKKYNELMQKFLKLAPDRSKEIKSELKQVKKEISNLIDFITQGKANDLSTVTEALRQRENQESRLQSELSRIEQNNNRTKLFVTPFVIQDRLGQVIQSIHQEKHRFSGLLAEIFHGPLVPKELEKGFCLEGKLDIFAAIAKSAERTQRLNPEVNRGSTQCAFASPTGIEPVFSP